MVLKKEQIALKSNLTPWWQCDQICTYVNNDFGRTVSSLSVLDKSFVYQKMMALPKNV